MKRSPLITVVIALQFLFGLLLAGVAVYLVTETRSSEILADPDAVETVHGLWIAAAVLGIPAVITLVAAWGLCKGRFWGWVLSVATDVGVLAVLLYNIVVGKNLEGSDTAVAALAVLVVLLLLPRVRASFFAVPS